jgi:dipeptidyl aminopeptidase/acylaminoacyl peptidase
MGRPFGTFVRLFLFGIALLCSAHFVAAQDGVVAIQKTDYRADRAAFQTKLLKQGPSPQPWRQQQIPAGVTEVQFASGDLQLKAWVGMPDTRLAKMPVVIFLHGGFAFAADDYAMAEPYRKAGFVIVTPMLRGENGQAGHFSMFYSEVDDVLAAEAYVRAQPYADPSRIFLAGHSVGGTLSLLAGMASPNFKGIASMSGSPDQVFFSRGWGEDAPFDLSDARELEMRSPLAYATSLKAPTRMYLGTEEQVYRETSKRLAKLAQEAKLDVIFTEKEGDHFGSVPAAIEDSIAFFNSLK